MGVSGVGWTGRQAGLPTSSVGFQMDIWKRLVSHTFLPCACCMLSFVVAFFLACIVTTGSFDTLSFVCMHTLCFVLGVLCFGEAAILPTR